MFIGGRVYVEAATVTNGKRSAATIHRVGATCGAAIVGVNGWDCSRSGVKKHHPHNIDLHRMYYSFILFFPTSSSSGLRFHVL
jgi:hypothetical protein